MTFNYLFSTQQIHYSQPRATGNQIIVLSYFLNFLKCRNNTSNQVIVQYLPGPSLHGLGTLPVSISLKTYLLPTREGRFILNNPPPWARLVTLSSADSHISSLHDISHYEILILFVRSDFQDKANTASKSQLPGSSIVLCLLIPLLCSFPSRIPFSIPPCPSRSFLWGASGINY